MLGIETPATAIPDGDVEAGYMAPWMLLGSCFGVPEDRSKIEVLSRYMFGDFDINNRGL